MEKTATASKGALYLIFSKTYFMITGYITYMVLTRVLGPELFGVYGIIIGLASMISMVLIGGINQATSKYISEEETLASSIKLSSLKLQCLLGGIISVIFFLFSPLIAKIFNDLSLTDYFRMASPIILFYALYGVYIGYVNGLKSFKKQALLEIIYSTTKTFLILILIYMGFALKGAIGGFVSATFLILLISVFTFGIKSERKEKFPMRKIFRFQLWILFYTLIINLLLNIDLFLIKSLSLKETANLYAGYYNAALTIARIPYLIIIPISYVIFPFISKSTSLKDTATTKSYISKGIRFCSIFLILCAVLIATNAEGIITLLYSKAYSSGALPLSIVCFGMIFLALILVSTTIISSSGLPTNSLIIVSAVLLVDFLLNYLAIPRFKLTGAAAATTISMGIGLFICVIYLKKKFSSFLPVKTLFKITAASGIILAFSYLFKTTGILLIVKLFFLSAIYLAILFLLKEISFINKIPFISLKE